MKRYRVVKEKVYRKKVFDKSFLHQNFSYFCNNFLLKKYDLRQEIACHKVLIKSNNFSDDTDESVYSIISVVRNRAQIQEAITICLEEPIHRMLEKLLKDLKTAGLNKIQKSGITAEIEAIRKQMILENSKDISAAPVLQNEGTESVIPENIKAYLFG